MNAIATVNPGLVPANMTEAMKLAEMMASAKLVPQGLQQSPADCLMVIQQAVRWQMDPFAVAQECSVIQGKLMHSGKLVAAVVNARGNLQERLSFAYEGDGDNRKITVSGRCQGEADRRAVTVRLGDVKTNNRVWQSQPDQQLMYHGCRVWARRHTPELMLGVWSPEEFDEAANGNSAAPIVIEHDQPGKRKSSAQAKRDGDWPKFMADVFDCETAVRLDALRREYRANVYPTWNKDWQDQAEAAFDDRQAELTAGDLKQTLEDSVAQETVDEDGVITTPNKGDFIRHCFDIIEAARDKTLLLNWFNSKDQKAERRRHGMNVGEAETMMDRIRERIRDLDMTTHEA